MNDILSNIYSKQNHVISLPKRAKNSFSEPYISDKTLSDFGAIDEIIDEIKRSIIRPFKLPHIYRQLKINPPNGILLHGPSGCGKTRLAEAIAGDLKIPIFAVPSTELVSGISGEPEAKIREIFSSAQKNAPCLVLFDEIDAICSKREISQRDMEKRISTQLQMCMDELNRDFLKGTPAIMVLATTRHPDQIETSLRRSGRFDKEIKLPIPSEKGRREILEILCDRSTLDYDVNLDEIVFNCPGYVPSDFVELIREASNIALDRICSNESNTFIIDENQILKISHQDFIKAIKIVQPSAKREGFVCVPNVTWSDIGALDSIRSELQMAVVEPIKNRKLFEHFGLHLPCGILLWGPPGCGKTMLAKAIANESHSNFLSIKGPELINKYLGESERAIRQVFERARASSPCIIFFDEIDSICPKRSDSGEGSSSRIVNQLLTEMDGIENRKDVYVIAATNRPDIIDPAMTRPGRLDKLLYIGLPNPDERFSILKTICSKSPVDSTIDLSVVASDPRCNNFSGADLYSLVREAAFNSIKEILNQKANNTYSIQFRHIDEAFTKVKSSTSIEEIEKYKSLAIF